MTQETNEGSIMTTITHLETSRTADSLQDLIEDKLATVGVIGLGYVGLPLCSAFLNAGFHTCGFEVDADKVAQLRAGHTYIKHFSIAQLFEEIAAEHFEPTSDLSRLSEPDALIICVPTPLNASRDPDLTYIESTAHDIAQVLRPGQLVVLESTTYPGTTTGVLLPILCSSGLRPGKDFFLAYSPEREDPGNPQYSANRIPKVVGGIDNTSLRLASALYQQAVVQVVPVSNCEVAEACKILENTYRSVNIAMVNELKMLFERLGIDIWEVIEAAKSKPFGYQAFYPGPGLGGHCIPIDPFYLSWLARREGQTTRFIELAGEINASMPEYVLHHISEGLNRAAKPLHGSKIALLGIAYKKDVDDPRESPSFRLLTMLRHSGAQITYNDPHIDRLPKMRHYDLPQLESHPLTPEFISEQDCIVIATDHSAYDYPMIVEHAQLVVDTRNACKDVVCGREKIIKA